MKWYEEIIRNQRIKKAEVTRDSLKAIQNIYKNAASNLEEVIEGMGDEGLKNQYLSSNFTALLNHSEKLQNELENQIRSDISKAANVGIDGNRQINLELIGNSGIDKNAFENTFAKIHQNVIDNIVTGGLYKDNKTLSNRIWNYTNANNKNIQEIIGEGLALKKSAKELANDLKEFSKPPKNRNLKFTEDYPKLVAKQQEYQAMRLARTAINHAYQTATIQSSMNNPFVEGIEWHSSLDHRACKVCISRHGKIYPKDDVPLDHPNGVCTMIPAIPKTFDEIGNEIADWINGEENPGIDDWVKFK